MVFWDGFMGGIFILNSLLGSGRNSMPLCLGTVFPWFFLASYPHPLVSFPEYRAICNLIMYIFIIEIDQELVILETG